jgi:hypothetical protein
MQDDLDRDIPADVQEYPSSYEEQGQLHQSIHDSRSRGVNIEGKPTKGFASEPSGQDSGGVERADFLPRLFGALHHSRRLQAARVIRSYKHLIDPECEYRLPGDPTKRSLEMSSDKAPSPATKAGFSPVMKILIAAAVVVSFVVFHIVGDEMFRGPLPAAKADMAGSNKYGD